MSPLENIKSRTSLLVLGSLGIVFGDIGTSPLYAFQECFSHGLTPTEPHVLGVISLILWGLMIVVSLKYVCIVMCASNRGEGGIFALTALASGGMRRLSRGTGPILIVGFCGAALFFGDSLITPAVSVMSAVEGLKIQAPELAPYIMPLSIFILILLFLCQRFGTQKVGSYFGPVMLVWFSAIGLIGLRAVVHHPDVLRALNPLYAIRFFPENGWLSFTVLGSAILAFTGAEALYADMGHFGAHPIRISWFFLVFPALILNYLGQGALLISNPEAVSNPFYLLVPKSMLMSMIILAAMATVIASQAVISGAFSIAQQAIQLGFLPRMSVRHTSADQYGQIYVPKVNWLLCAGVLLLIMLFRSSSSLAEAYGFAVMGTMVATSILVFSVSRHIWHWSFQKIIGILVPFFMVDLALFSTAVLKIPEGGWLPFCIGVAIFVIFITWYQGRELIMERRRGVAKKLETFVENLQPDQAVRVEGTAIYLSNLRAVVPTTMVNNLRHNKVLHERVIVLHIQNEEDPRVPEENRLTVKRLQHGFWQVTLHYGFMERPNVMEDLQTYLLADCPIEANDTSFFLGHDVFVASDVPPIKPLWREKLFLWLANNASGMSEYFRIPTERVVEFGIQIRV